jgi:hypothetical protein
LERGNLPLGFENDKEGRTLRPNAPAAPFVTFPSRRRIGTGFDA